MFYLELSRPQNESHFFKFLTTVRQLKIVQLQFTGILKCDVVFESCVVLDKSLF